MSVFSQLTSTRSCSYFLRKQWQIMMSFPFSSWISNIFFPCRVGIQYIPPSFIIYFVSQQFLQSKHCLICIVFLPARYYPTGRGKGGLPALLLVEIEVHIVIASSMDQADPDEEPRRLAEEVIFLIAYTLELVLGGNLPDVWKTVLKFCPHEITHVIHVLDDLRIGNPLISFKPSVVPGVTIMIKPVVADLPVFIGVKDLLLNKRKSSHHVSFLPSYPSGRVIVHST